MQITGSRQHRRREGLLLQVERRRTRAQLDHVDLHIEANNDLTTSAGGKPLPEVFNFVLIPNVC